MTERRAAAIGDITQDQRIPQDAYRPTFVRSLAMVPVQHDNPVAALGAYWARVRTIQPREIELLQTVANASALAIAYVRAATGGESQAKLISDERDHRLHNALAVVQAIVNRTLHDDPDRAATINSRVKALLTSDEILGNDQGSATTIRDILRAELEPYGGRIELTGDELELPPDRTRAVSAIVHEWSTNAAKYGAFSVPNGRLSVSWRRAGDEIRIVWQELNGPKIEGAKKRGFGTYFVERVTADIGGTVETEMRPLGIVHVLRFRIP
jgi:two-component sensor histidine kinase